MSSSVKYVVRILIYYSACFVLECSRMERKYFGTIQYKLLTNFFLTLHKFNFWRKIFHK